MRNFSTVLGAEIVTSPETDLRRAKAWLRSSSERHQLALEAWDDAARAAGYAHDDANEDWAARSAYWANMVESTWDLSAKERFMERYLEVDGLKAKAVAEAESAEKVVVAAIKAFEKAAADLERAKAAVARALAVLDAEDEAKRLAATQAEAAREAKARARRQAEDARDATAATARAAREQAKPAPAPAPAAVCQTPAPKPAPVVLRNTQRAPAQSPRVQNPWALLKHAVAA